MTSWLMSCVFALLLGGDAGPAARSQGAVFKSKELLRDAIRLLTRGPSLDLPGAGSQSATVKVTGTIVLEVAVIAGDVTVAAGPKGEVSIEIDNATESVSLDQRGRRVRARFDGRDALRRGDVRVKVPPGSGVVLTSVSGDLRVTGVGGDADLRAVSGDVSAEDVAELNVEVVSGSVTASRIRGAVDIETVSGSAEVASVPRDDSRASFETTSGDLRWRGRCGTGCRIEGETLSGSMLLELDPKSSFEVRLSSFSGGLEHDVSLQNVQERGQPGRGVEISGRRGKGAGLIELETFSGTLKISSQR